LIAGMNTEASALGMEHTIDTDPSGFDRGTVSTAADQLCVFQQAMNFRAFRQIVAMASVTLPVAGTLTNFNPLIAEGYAGITGSDSAAGGCLGFFTQLTAGGRTQTAVGVVLGQGQSSDASGLLAAAGEAPGSFSSPSPQRSACARSLRPPQPAAQEETPAALPSATATRSRSPLGTALLSTQPLPAGEHVNRRRRALAALAPISTAAVISACGSNAPDSGGNTAANAKEAVKFSECMRSNGVSHFPDPGASGKLTIDAVANRSSLNPNTLAFKQALSACKALEPAGFTGSKWSPQQQQAALRFAECIRKNGVNDFPDPTPHGPLIDTNRIPSAAEPGGMSALHAAMQKCRDAAAAAGVTR
jgi:hypothetical protein